jgi:hypothetical protein
LNSTEKTAEQVASPPNNPVTGEVTPCNLCSTSDGLDTYRKLQSLVRQIPLGERLQRSRQMISKMCSERRPPRMSIPVHHMDEDIFIITTLADASELLEALLQPERAEE